MFVLFKKIPSSKWQILFPIFIKVWKFWLFYLNCKSIKNCFLCMVWSNQLSPRHLLNNTFPSDVQFITVVLEYYMWVDLCFCFLFNCISSVTYILNTRVFKNMSWYFLNRSNSLLEEYLSKFWTFAFYMHFRIHLSSSILIYFCL